ncbi:hypothetical protein X777_11969 [Ooceraea biroi]|uniref:Integrase catalytic domain-containing protein n=1 Tax=Ooceraea biroi TaxID=2015173 RepID=A0A026X4B6_OOCBI|nr:hypothetical protein X777_11969 [Ooceraea biroi]
MQDRFTKWVEIRPIRRTTASTILAALTDAIILRHGCPEEILTDNGTQFRTAKVTGPLADLRIRHRFIPLQSKDKTEIDLYETTKNEIEIKVNESEDNKREEKGKESEDNKIEEGKEFEDNKIEENGKIIRQRQNQAVKVAGPGFVGNMLVQECHY